MDFGFREEEEAVVDLARKILEDHATNERKQQLERAGTPYDGELWRALAESSLLGTAIPEAFGGADLGFVALSLLMREVGRTVAPVPVYPSLVLGALPLARFGTEEQKRRWLPGVATGEHILTAALSELEASDPRTPATRAEPSAGGYRLSGTKTTVPYAEQAARIVVPARFADASIGLFLVDPEGDGVTRTAQTTPDGQPHAEIAFREAPVDADARLHPHGDGASALRWLVDRATAARCMMQLGVTERALEMTAQYSRDRLQFERPIGSFQAVHQRAADAYIHVDAIRLTALEAVWRLSRDLPADEHVAVAKFWAAEGGHFASTACQHLHGGIGIDVEYPLHRYFTWATHLEHDLGSARHQLERLGRAIATDGLAPS